MARYVDADSLLEQISKKKCEVGKIRYLDGFNDGLMRVRSIISAAPTADVVPKSEVEKLKSDLLVWKQNRFNIFQRLECYEMTRQKIAREIFEEIEKLHLHITNEFDVRRYTELKKKYTEEKK